ncbi:MAG: WYL domain-containing protein [Oscillospiraceae bacterium]|nr:WYL domain-containing protein [Oscillospiraceae bacterium]
MPHPKSRILTILRFLETQTDEQNPATLADILTHLQKQGIDAGRKAVLSDIEQLADSGVDVICNKSRELQYFIGDRHFELPELKLLIDAVQASKFIPVKKSKELIKKLTAFASRHQAVDLNRTLYTDKQIKSGNESVFITVDKLHTAIGRGRQIHFKYYEYDQNKKKQYKHKRQIYKFSPYSLIWNGDHYYAVGYSESHGKIITFRVDRIAKPELTGLTAQPKPKDFDPAFYAQKVFQMYDGAMRDVVLKCENSLMKSVIDRFGEKVDTAVLDEEHFEARVSVCASPTFYGWVFSFAGRMEITAPDDVIDGYITLASFVPKKP